MAQILVRVIDKVNPDDPYLDIQCMKRGDVVAVVSDDHVFSEYELSAPWWRVIKVPGVDPAKLSAYTAPEEGDWRVTKTLRKRVFKFDLDAYLTAKRVSIETPPTAYERRKRADGDLVPRKGTKMPALPDMADISEALGYRREKPAVVDPLVLK